MSDHPPGQPQSREEFDAWLNEGVEESVRAASAQALAASMQKPLSLRSSLSKQNPPKDCTPAADHDSLHPEDSGNAERQPKPRRINPAYVKEVEPRSIDRSCDGANSEERPLEQVEGSSPAPNFKELPPKNYPTAEERPCYRLYYSAFTIGEKACRPGVYEHFMAGKGEESYPADAWMCAPLDVPAKTANKEDGEYGRLLAFSSSNGVEKKWSMPMELLAGDGVELLERLLSEGLEIGYARRKKIPDYIASAQPLAFLHCATRTGWHSRGTFVLPDFVIGRQDIWFQSHMRVAAYAQAGSYQKWKDHVAALAVGNQFLLFGLSFSLCGPLLLTLNFSGSGIHLYGDSTTGKTSVLEAGASSWGNGGNYKRTWRATANGLEGVCAQHTDTLLVLDEISEISTRDLDQVAYFMVNGQGKSRATRHGEAKPEMRWRVALLSSGEQSIGAKLYSGGISIRAGQQMRILDIPICGKHGLFDELHDFANGAAFADALRAAASTHYGHAGPEFVKAVIKKGGSALSLMHRCYLKELATGDSQEDRAAGRIFALAALAGELAIEAGIVPWPQYSALGAAKNIFAVWREQRVINNCSGEHAEILSKVLNFIDAHGTARFSNIDPSPGEPLLIVRDRAGWWEDGEDQEGNPIRFYLFTAGALKEATKGYEHSRVLRALEIAGALVRKGSDGEKAANRRTPERPQVKLYHVNPTKLIARTSSGN